MKWSQFHDRPRPRWFEATRGFLKLSPSGPKFPIVYSGKIIQNGGGVLLVPLKNDWNKQDLSEIWKRHVLIKPENEHVNFFAELSASFKESYPGCQRFLAGRFVTCRPKAGRLTIETLTETGNRTRQTSGTQGKGKLKRK